MPLTPTDINNVTFSKPPIGKRGYNEEEVDAFLDLVGTELARYLKEINDLHSRVDQLNQQLRAASTETAGNLRALPSARSVVPAVPSSTAKPTSPTGDSHTQAAKVLGMAQQIADRLTNDAKADADKMLSQCRTTTQQMLSEAQAKADGMINEARGRAQTMVNDARTRAETLDRNAREKATALERDAARKHTEILGAINHEKEVLEKKIDELHTFEREYRTRLETYLNAQLRELENRAALAPEDRPRNQHGFAAPNFDAHIDPVLLRNAG